MKSYQHNKSKKNPLLLEGELSHAYNFVFTENYT